MLRALAILPMSDRVCRSCVGWAVSAPRSRWIWAFPFLAAGVAVCAVAQGLAFVMSLSLFGLVAVCLGIGNFGFYSDKKIALRYFEDVPQIVLSALFMYFKGAADTNAIINASARHDLRHLTSDAVRLQSHHPHLLPRVAHHHSPACRSPKSPPPHSAILMTVHVLRDVVGEFKRIAKARRERKISLASGDKGDDDEPTAEDLADALDGRRQVAHLMLGAPWCSALTASILGISSLFVLPGAARFALCLLLPRPMCRSTASFCVHAASPHPSWRRLIVPPAVLLMGKTISAKVVDKSATVDSFKAVAKSGATPRRARKPWWRPASREQAVSWAAALALVIFIAVFSSTYNFTPPGYSGGGIEVLPLQRFSSNLGGMSGSGRFVFVSYGGAAAGRRLAAASPATTASTISSFRVTTSTSTTSTLAAAASEPVTLTDAATGAAAAFDGDPIAVLRCGSTIILVTSIIGLNYMSSSTASSASTRLRASLASLPAPRKHLTCFSPSTVPLPIAESYYFVDSTTGAVMLFPDVVRAHPPKTHATAPQQGASSSEPLARALLHWS